MTLLSLMPMKSTPQLVKHEAVLEAASWTVEYVVDEENGNFYNAVSPTEDLGIQFFYVPAIEALEIWVIGAEPEVEEENVVFPTSNEHICC